MKKIKQFLAALVLFVIFDFIWLGLVMKSFNMRQLAEIGRFDNGEFQMQYAAASVTYILMALALPIFVLPKINVKDSFLKVFATGALMGLIIYGVFDTTNFAILKNYPLAFVGPDIVWGAFVYGLVTVIGAKLNA
jgi:uncharacterized membrane protein